MNACLIAFGGLLLAGRIGAISGARRTVTKQDTVFVGTWPTETGDTKSDEFKTAAQAVRAAAKKAAGGLRFHDLRHSHTSWLITSGVPVPDDQRVMGHERPTISTPTCKTG